MIRLITFATAFLAGVFITSAAEWPGYDTHDCTPPAVQQKPAERLSVEYAGWDHEDGYPRIRIRVTNGLTSTISHFAHSAESPFAQITRNGEKIFLFHCGTGAKDHYLYPGSSFTAAWDINPRGDIVGVFQNAAGVHGFVLTADGYTTIDYPGATATRVFGINARGDLVGAYVLGGKTFGFLARRV